MLVSLLIDEWVPKVPSAEGGRMALNRGTVVVWPSRHLALVRGESVRLTRGESVMLETLVAARGEPVSRSALAAVWRLDGRRSGARAVDVRISALRKKLGDNARAPRLIVTVSGVGYAIHIDYVVGDRAGAA